MSDLLLLLYFKYTNFLVSGLNHLLVATHLTAPLVFGTIGLPLGISFFTFHKISYKVDVFRGNVSAKRNLLDLALYILFFPQLIAGPIVRYNEISATIGTLSRVLSRERFSRGVQIFTIGLSKKMLIANTVAFPADQIFSLPMDQLTTPLAWLGIICYSLQIYFDFSGYSDMAVGLACVFGFDFPKNFNYPYIADSVTDFWRRWHISLSRWFRDYLYIPLGGNRVSSGRLYFNLITVFFLCGLWHGAAWVFLLWGLFHGLFLALERAFLGNFFSKIPRPLRHIYLLLVIMIGWVFFRASSLTNAIHYLGIMFGIKHPVQLWYYPALYLTPPVIVAIFFGILGSTPLISVVRHYVFQRIEGLSPEKALVGDSIYQMVKLSCLVVCLTLSIMLIAAGTYNPFIYFRF
jgi:alginate O-acetyltransferase complex protein AlgI